MKPFVIILPNVEWGRHKGRSSKSNRLFVTLFGTFAKQQRQWLKN